MPPYKFKYDGETKKITIESESISFNDLLREIKVAFPQLASLSDGVLSFCWHDSDGDKIRCQTDREIETAVSELTSLGKSLTFQVEIAAVNFSLTTVVVA